MMTTGPSSWARLVVLAGSLLAGCRGERLPSLADNDAVTPTTAGWLNEMLEPIRQEFRLPALAALVMQNGQVVAQGAVGVRRSGSSEPVTVNDRFHIGSVTKPMTATLAARLVEQGRWRWNMPIGEVFTNQNERINPRFRPVTLEQLLRHRSGLPANPAFGWHRAAELPGLPVAQRLELVLQVLSRPPEYEPGTEHRYSNTGYVVVGAMIEQALGQPWEEAIRARLFDPLGMASAGFGAPASPGRADQPWGHARGLFGMRPVPPGPAADNPPVLGPAGRVHCSLADLGKFVQLHLDGVRGQARLLEAGSFADLHRPLAGDDWGMGWSVPQRDWAGGRTFTHAGSNTTFYLVVWAAPQRNFAVIVATNCGVDDAATACDRVAAQTIARCLETRTAPRASEH